MCTSLFSAIVLHNERYNIAKGTIDLKVWVFSSKFLFRWYVMTYIELDQNLASNCRHYFLFKMWTRLQIKDLEQRSLPQKIPTPPGEIERLAQFLFVSTSPKKNTFQRFFWGCYNRPKIRQTLLFWSTQFFSKNTLWTYENHFFSHFIAQFKFHRLLSRVHKLGVWYILCSYFSHLASRTMTELHTMFSKPCCEPISPFLSRFVSQFPFHCRAWWVK